MKKERKNSLTNQPGQVEILLIAVYLLGGDKKSIDTEDIAVKADELAPGSFAWQKYPEHINLELVRVQLSNAKKPEIGKFLSGSGRNGWRLTPKGIDWYGKIGKKLLKKGKLIDLPQPTSSGSIDSVRKRREKKRLLSSPAWETWTEDKTISYSNAEKIFRIDEYVTGDMVEKKVVRLLSLFQTDKQIEPFLKKAGELVLDTRE